MKIKFEFMPIDALQNSNKCKLQKHEDRRQYCMVDIGKASKIFFLAAFEINQDCVSNSRFLQSL